MPLQVALLQISGTGRADLGQKKRDGEDLRKGEKGGKKPENFSIMIVFQSPVQLLVLGAFLVSPASLQPSPCEVVRNTAAYGSYQLSVHPLFYKPNSIYTISIPGIENGTSVILQAVTSADGASNGMWEMENHLLSCSKTENLVQRNITSSGTRTRWTSPSNTNVASAQIRAFVSFANGTTLLQTQNLVRDVATTPSAATHPTTDSHKPTLHGDSTHTHVLLNATMNHHNLASSHQWTKGPNSSVSMAGASSFVLAVLQLFSISLGYKLLS
uniref:Placenta-expressed transcript 1 protein n=1 Tax=Pogona vitticeps TaxID=103695 RepID=A0ABM5EQI7_9SAUR